MCPDGSKTRHSSCSGPASASPRGAARNLPGSVRNSIAFPKCPGTASGFIMPPSFNVDGSPQTTLEEQPDAVTRSTRRPSSRAPAGPTRLRSVQQWMKSRQAHHYCLSTPRCSRLPASVLPWLARAATARPPALPNSSGSVSVATRAASRPSSSPRTAWTVTSGCTKSGPIRPASTGAGRRRSTKSRAEPGSSSTCRRAQGGAFSTPRCGCWSASASAARMRLQVKDSPASL